MSGVLVTGGAGQLGRAFAGRMPDAVVLDRASLDITDPDQVQKVLTDVRPDVIYNTAAYTAVDRAEIEPEEAHRVIVDGVANLATEANRAGALLVHFSSDYVFRGNAGPYSEADDPDPLSVYGRTKLASERAAAQSDRHLVVRASWVFGEGRNFVRSVVQAAEGREELSVVDDQRGRPTYAVDLAAGVEKLVRKGRTGVYHLAGGGEAATWADVAETALRAAGLGCRVLRVTTEKYYAGREGPIAPRPANSELDCSRASRDGISLRPWPQAVAEYVKKLKRS
ncbi:MAG TPA: dTDP-4-dehydrorhamnose reductase [Actinomycetota bacterium]|nr:dTDP-4-dehydrorhamnose reductase [Actinomycetota bacterium]